MNAQLIDRLHAEAENYGLHEDVRALLREAIAAIAAPKDVGYRLPDEAVAYRPTTLNLSDHERYYNTGWNALLRRLAAPSNEAAPQADQQGASTREQRMAALAEREEVLKDYVADYEYLGETEDGRDACYQPNERERLLIEDAIRGWDSLEIATPASKDQQGASLEGERAIAWRFIDGDHTSLWSSPEETMGDERTLDVAIENGFRIEYAYASPTSQSSDTHAFQNFHRMLCERFDYPHDPVDWRRDQVSLMEHIAALSKASPDDQRQEGAKEVCGAPRDGRTCYPECGCETERDCEYGTKPASPPTEAAAAVGEVDWRWHYRFVTMMRAMDNGLLRPDAERFADDDVRALERAALSPTASAAREGS